ncbi:MAG TPA: hypothetical protein VKR61_02025 [Bryobacteraceae bacterium]|nr:hypothetical protein [Bryobacteraceae bacterium]
MSPAFVIAGDSNRTAAVRQAGSLIEPCAAILGFQPNISLRSLDEPGLPPPGANEIFVLPASFDFSVWQKEVLGRTLAEWRRSGDGIVVHADEMDLAHPLIVQCFADLITAALAGSQIPPQGLGLLLVASGHGDSASRAQSYRVMRLVWEQLGLAAADVAFVRHAQPFLGQALERCLREPLEWVLLPQMQWSGEHFDYACVILENFQREHSQAAGWRLLDPPGAHPALSAWLTQRIVQLWRNQRGRDATRTPSARRQSREEHTIICAGDPAAPAHGLVAEIPSAAVLADLLAPILPPSDKYFIKVTWHGYSPGTFTDPAALDLLLAALPGKAVILEGHTSSRNLGGADWDWETEAQCHRAWIQQQDAEYLSRTGLAEVMRRHGAQYVNVTESFWDGRCVPRHEVLRHVDLRYPELAAFIPELLWENRGAPFISFAKFKGPTRLGISNLFGLIPAPLRSAWHGPDITHFAHVCCDLARLYGSLFPMFGIVEALYTAVRWDRQGLYRSRWGNYDILANRGVLTMSQGLPAADLLASRLQGQDIARSAFFDVVRNDLGWPAATAECLLPQSVLMRFV